MDCSPPGSSVHGILQARILEGAAIFSSRGSSLPRDGTLSSCIAGRYFTTESPGKPHPHSKQIVIFLYIYYKYICITNLNIIDIEIFSYKFILKIFNKILDLFGLDL